MAQLQPQHYRLKARLAELLPSRVCDVQAIEEHGVILNWHQVRQLIAKLEFGAPQMAEPPDTSWAKTGEVRHEGRRRWMGVGRSTAAPAPAEAFLTPPSGCQ